MTERALPFTTAVERNSRPPLLFYRLTPSRVCATSMRRGILTNSATSSDERESKPMDPRQRDLCLEARAIWQAGVDAVKPARLLTSAMQVRGNVLTILDRQFRIDDLGRIAVVGAGKAGAG